MIRLPFKDTKALGEHADTAKVRRNRAKKMEKKKKKQVRAQPASLPNAHAPRRRL